MRAICIILNDYLNKEKKSPVQLHPKKLGWKLTMNYKIILFSRAFKQQLN